MSKTEPQSIQPVQFPEIAWSYIPHPTWRDHARSIKRELLTYAQAVKSRPHSSKPKIKFCVFALGRTGSTLLFDLANSHPAVQCEAHAKQTEVLRNRYLWPRRYLEARAALCPADAYGFKLQLGHLTRFNPTDPQRFIRDLHANGWKMIYLIRRDILRQGLSQAIATQTQVWHRMQTASGKVERCEENRPDWNKVNLRIDLLREILDFLEANQKYSDYVMSDIPHLKMVYEDDLFTSEQQAASMKRVYEYLGLPSHEVSSRFVRTSRDSLHDTLENADEIIAAMRGTRYESFLSEADLKPPPTPAKTE